MSAVSTERKQTFLAKLNISSRCLPIIPSVRDSSQIAVEIFKFARRKEKYSDVQTIALWSKWQISKVFADKRYLARDYETWHEFQHVKGIQVCFAHASIL